MSRRRYPIERDIATHDGGGIRRRWLYGLRLLRDPAAMSPGGGGLRHGVGPRLVAEAKARDLKLSETELRYRIQCAKAYPTEAQITKILGDFRTWWDLIQARFPAYDAPAAEPPADHRTDAEKASARAQALLQLTSEQGTLFPLSKFEPGESTLKELVDYADKQETMTAGFAAHDRKRRDYVNTLVAAVDDDLSALWQDAHWLAFPTTEGR